VLSTHRGKCNFTPMQTHVYTDTHAINLKGFQVESFTLTDNTDVGIDIRLVIDNSNYDL
jgi:hypothetical protein